VVRRSPLRWLAGFLAFGAAVGTCAFSALFAQDRGPARPADAPAPQDPYRLTRNIPGDAKPIVLHADEIATWPVKDFPGEHLAVLLRGTVLVQQNVVNARCQQAFAWVDLRQYRVSNLVHVQVYAEGATKVDDGSEVHAAPRAILDLTTRGEFRLLPYKAKMVQQSLADDPVVQRARAFGLGPPIRPAPAPGPVQRTGLQGPAPAPALAPTPGTPVPPAPAPRQIELPAFLTPGRPTPPVAPPAAAPPVATPPAGPPTAPASGLLRTSYQTSASSETLNNTPGVPGQGTPANPPISPLPIPMPGGVPPGGPPIGPGPPTGVSISGQPPAGTVPAAPGIPTPGPGSQGSPAPLPPPSKATPPPPGPPAAPTQVRNFTVAPRHGQSFNLIQTKPLPNGEQALIVTGGVIVTVRNAPNAGLIDLEADRLVIWHRGGDSQKAFGNMQTPQGQDGKHIELYLSGNVEMRNQSQNKLGAPPTTRTIRADELYYDVDRSVAVAIKTQMEMKMPKVPDPILLNAAELFQLNVNTFEMTQAEASASKLPSDPGFKVYMASAVVEDRTIPMVSIFGRPVLDRKTGLPLQRKQSIVNGRNAFVELENIPIFYSPYLKMDARNPLGPLQQMNVGYSMIYGTTFSFTWDMYQLLGIQQPPQTSWRINTDYLSFRGPALGTSYNRFTREFFGIEGLNTIGVQGYMMDDRDFDNLGGPRPMNDFNPTAFRGWLQYRQTVQELPNGFNVISQVVGISDRNFVEQYYKRIWDTDVNQDSFLYVKQQQDNWAWSVLGEGRTRAWITETNWFPRVDGWLIGQSFFNLLTYDAHPQVAAASLQVINGTQNTISPTDRYDTTGRFDLWQDLSAPFRLGPLKVVPYGNLDLTQYTNDLSGNDVGRIYAGGGARVSLDLTRIYPGIQSDLLNLNGINHKIVASANYYNAWTNESYLLFPQLDRLNDDSTDQALRDIYPLQPFLNPNFFVGQFLIHSNLFQPQEYAIQNLLFSRVDTLNTIEELQLDVRQRLQTKRGYPGYQHIVDWMTLDVSAIFFPNATRDDFGVPWSYYRYNWLWNIGDRTSLESTAWVDPITNGPKVWTVGAFFNRPDRTNFYLGFRELDPLGSRLVTASVTYVFSPKYAGTLSTSYDFGLALAMSNSIMFTRIGSDLTATIGLTYNAMQNSIGAIVSIVPNLVPAGKVPTLSGGGGGGFMGR
jgi:hypothetical protein